MGQKQVEIAVATVDDGAAMKSKKGARLSLSQFSPEQALHIALNTPLPKRKKASKKAGRKKG
jgi:hypothetical protein